MASTRRSTLAYSAQQIGQVELGHRRPSPQLAEACDRIFAVKLFPRLLRHIHNEAFPSWFQLYAELEAVATHLRFFGALLVTGLLQNEDYARAVLSASHSGDRLEELVAARMQRQRILDREDPPRLTVMLDESTLRHPIGGPDVMAGNSNTCSPQWVGRASSCR
jgi:hypothetical protein